MKRKLVIGVIGMIPIFILLITLPFCKREVKDEIKEKDHYIQVTIEKLDFDKEFVIFGNDYKYLFDRLEKGITEEGGYEVKFGERDYFVGKNNESFYQYALENDTLDYYLMIGIEKSIKKAKIKSKEVEISIMVIRKIENLND